jgi:hypothetical protein
MRARDAGSNSDRWLSSIGRGAATFACIGAGLGGIAGTLDWPIVGTFFTAVPTALAGAAVGSVAAAALTLLAQWTRSRWAARVTAGAVAGAAAVAGGILHPRPIPVPTTLAMALVVAGTVVAAACGPLIAFGLEPAPERGLPRLRASRLIGRFVGWGAALGAIVGAVAGLVIGIHAYLPTSPFAAVEGGVLGAVSGVVLACLAAGVAVLPRLRARQ